MSDTILKRITDFYLDSGDFNGMPLAHLSSSEDAETIEMVEKLIEEGLVDVLSPGDDVNTHVKRMGVASRDTQRAALRNGNFHHTCLYPSPDHLARAVDRSRYSQSPYTLELALGAAQLDFRSFDLAVLEVYRNDPRYRYDCGTTHGFICISDEYYESEQMHERDKILLESFGFSYDGNFDRAVAAFVCYLSRLSPEHQQIWKARELHGEFRLHPAYYRSSILGHWPTEIPVFEAFAMEMRVVNDMVKAMGRPPLFRSLPEGDLKSFTFLIRPTQAEFDAFAHTLDKLISDNINKDFFMGEVADATETERADGKIVVQQKGTLQMLNEWVRARFRTDDWKPWEEAFATMRKVRKLRQAPAHALRDDVFKRELLKEQRTLIVDAYNAVRTVRLMLANHPATRGVEVNEYLREGRICSY